MQNTYRIYFERSEEIDYYFNVIKPLENDKILLTFKMGKKYSNILKKEQFFKILKSNFLLMLYNLIESTIINGLLEIYESIKEEGCSYNDIIDEIQNIWVRWKIGSIYSSNASLDAYKNKVKELITEINDNITIVLSKDCLDISGNLDAKKIKNLCKEHKITPRSETRGECLRRVKDDRNRLAHGEVSFSDCSRDLTVNDLEKIKDDVFAFLEGILKNMNVYYEQKLYKRESNL